MKKTVYLDGESLKIEEVVAIARNCAKAVISPGCIDKIKKSRAYVESIVKQNKIAYGITTGCGPMCNRLIPPDKAKEFQRNLVRSHSAGAGEALPISVVRATMVARANSLVKGRSGIRLEVLQTLIDMINKQVHPYIPEQGSVGASGDLVHLAHIALTLTGEGEVFYNREKISAAIAMKRAGIKPVELSYKEGLALMNGTSCMTGISCLNIYDALRLVKEEEIAAAMAIEALYGTWEAFDERLHKCKPHAGQVECASRLKKMLESSNLVKQPTEIRNALQQERQASCDVLMAHNEIQNPYTLRCTPQVLGAVKDTVLNSRKVVETELNSANDNPLIFEEDDFVLHGGNFHGQYISMYMDYLTIAMTELSLLSERRLARILDEKLNCHLGSFLIKGESGFLNGFMGTQYLASSNVAENRVLCNPVSVFSVSTNASNQDIVSMGTVSARKARMAINNAERVVAVELMCNAQALDIAGVNKAGKASKAAYAVIREKVSPLNSDRIIYPDINEIILLMHSESIINAVEKVIS